MELILKNLHIFKPSDGAYSPFFYLTWRYFLTPEWCWHVRLHVPVTLTETDTDSSGLKEDTQGRRPQQISSTTWIQFSSLSLKYQYHNL